MTHHFSVQVYYEDTDLAGVVYHANYLKFIERARSTMVLEAGIDQLDMQAQGVVFAVKKLEADYIGSAKLNDVLRIETSIKQVTGAKVVFQQDAFRSETLIFSALVTVICVVDVGKITRFPADIRAKLNEVSK